ncbi:MAG: hypothetical protein ACLQBA_04455 [Candidatus Binataceae bacterium]
MVENGLIRFVESQTDANEMAMVSAGMANTLIGTQSRRAGLTMTEDWTLKQWAQCARAALAIPQVIEDTRKLEQIYASPLAPYTDVKTYLNKLIELALEHVVAAWKGSARLKEDPVVKRVLATGPLALLHFYGDKNTAEYAVSLVLSLVSTNVIRTIAALEHAS